MSSISVTTKNIHWNKFDNIFTSPKHTFLIVIGLLVSANLLIFKDFVFITDHRV